MNIIKKIKKFLFNKKCPNVRCSCCKYFYYDKNYNRRCKIIDRYKIRFDF